MRGGGVAGHRGLRSRMQIGERLPDIELRTADGEPVPLPGDLERVTVVQLLRYYG